MAANYKFQEFVMFQRKPPFPAPFSTNAWWAVIVCTIRGTSLKHRHSDRRAQVRTGSDVAPSGGTRGGVGKTSTSSLKLLASTVSQTGVLIETKSTVWPTLLSKKNQVCCSLVSTRYLWFALKEYRWHPPIPCLGPLQFSIPVIFPFNPIISPTELGRNLCVYVTNEKLFMCITNKPRRQCQWISPPSLRE